MIEYRNRSLAYRCRYPYPRFDRPIALPRGVLRGLLQDRMPRHRPPRGLFGFPAVVPVRQTSFVPSASATRLRVLRSGYRHCFPNISFLMDIRFLWIVHAHGGRALRGGHLAPRQAGILFDRCRTYGRDRPYPFKHGLHFPLHRTSTVRVVFGIARPPSSAWNLRSLRCLFQ